MALTLGELDGQVLRLLNKTAVNRGFYTVEKVRDAVNEAMDFVSCEMFDADEGWLTKVWPMTVADGQILLNIPEDCVLIKDVRVKIGGVYVPCTYDAGNSASRTPTDTTARSDGTVYSILDNAIRFDPPLSTSETVGGVQIEGHGFPQYLIDDQDFIEAQFNRCMTHFMKYKAASILAAGIEKMSRPWAAEEEQWYAKMLRMVTTRNQQPTPIREFDP